MFLDNFFQKVLTLYLVCYILYTIKDITNQEKEANIMLDINGQYNTARVFTDDIEESAKAQIMAMCNQDFLDGSRIRIMPDVHAGKGCTIGTTMTIKNKVVPNYVGVDIGCGMETVRIREKRIELQKLDKLIRTKIPSGFNIRSKPHKYSDRIDVSKLCYYGGIKAKRALLSIGTLGGGNHFIEVDKDEAGNLYIVIHSGSRHVGVETANYYQNKAFKKGTPYCEGTLFDEYIHDMKIVQEYAMINRQAMMNEIVTEMKLHIEDQFTTVHNYIDTDSMILRKGAVSAKTGERLLIPINMRDGSIICTGKGNPDWNYSAPHGAGRLMSRIEAKQCFTVSEFKKQMDGIYTTSVNASTLDECPMAYKSMSSIVENIKDTVDIVEIIKPIYNFKAGDENV